MSSNGAGIITSTSFDTPGKRAGLAVIATAGLLSAVSTFTLLSYFVYCTLRTRSSSFGLSTPLVRGVHSFLQSALGRYLVFLILSDFLQGSAFATNYYWASLGRMDESPPCVFQGGVSQVGDLGAALWSNVIAFQTFALLFMQYKPPHSISVVTSIVIWIALLLLPILGPTAIQNKADGPFWGLSGAWCWVGGGYQLSRLLYLYVWVFLNLLCCFTIYTLIYLKYGGYVSYDPTRWHRIRWRTRARRDDALVSNAWASTVLSMHFKQSESLSNNSLYEPNVSVQGYDSSSVSRDAARVARRLMWYPIVYALVTIPVAICRLGVLAGWTPPFWLFVFAGTCFSSSGISNTLLFLFTRHAFIQRTLQHPPVCSVATREVAVRVDDPFPLSLTPTSATPFSHFQPPSPIRSFDSSRGEKMTQQYHYLRTSRTDPFKVILTPASPSPTIESTLLSTPSPTQPRFGSNNAGSGGGGGTPFNYYSYQYRQPRSPDMGPSPLSIVLQSDANTAITSAKAGPSL